MKRWISFAAVFAMLLSMFSTIALAIEPIPTDLAVEVTGDIIEGWQFHEDFVYNPETEEEELLECYFYGELLEVTVTYSDGSFQKGSLYDLKYGYNLDLKLVDDQADGKWALGTHSFTVMLGELSASGEIEVVSTPVESIEATCTPIVEGTEGGYSTDYDTQLKVESDYYYNYYFDPLVTLTVTMKSGETVSGSPDEIWEQTEHYPEFDDDQSAETPWGVGKHTATVNFMGFVAPLEVEILESDLVSFEVKDTTLTEGMDTENRTDYDEEGNEHNWKAYWYLNQVEFVVNMKDREPFCGTRADIFEEFGIWVEYCDNQSYADQWGVGEHQATFYLLGDIVNGKIIVEESDIRSVSVAPISLESYTHGSFWNIWDDYGEKIGTWYHYDWADCLEYTVELKDGTTNVYDYSEIYEQFGVNVEYEDDQSRENPWGIGLHRGTVELLGKNCAVEITITESPYTAVSVQFPAIYVGEHQFSEEWEENGETFIRYYYDYRSIAEITLTDRDGNQATYSSDELIEAFGLNIHFEDDQDEGDWGAGTHTVICSLAGMTCETTLTILDNPIKSVSATATCIENWDIILHTGYNDNGDEAEWYEYEFFNKAIITVVTDTETIVGTAEEIEARLGLSVSIDSDQPTDRLWEVGTHEFTVQVGGQSGEGILTIEPTPIESLTVTAPTYTELSGGNYNSIYDEEGNETGDRWYCYDLWNGIWLEIALKDGRTYSGDYSGLEEALGISLSLTDPQSAESPWGVGTHTASLNCMGYKVNFEVTIEASNVVSIYATAPDMIENTGGYMDLYYDETLGEYVPFYYYTVSDSLVYVVTLTDGDPIVGSSQAVFDALGVYPTVYETQAADGGWGVGSHSVTVELMGRTATVNVEITETPVAKIELSGPNAFYQGLDDYPQDIYNEETGEYEPGWNCFMPEESCGFIVTMKDGRVFKGSLYEICEKFDFLYNFNITHDQAYDNEWQVGMHSFDVSFLGYLATFDIEVKPYPVQSITFANPVTLYHDAFCYDNTYIDEDGNEFFYTAYSYEPYYTVTLSDGSVLTGSAATIEKEFGWAPSLQVQTPENQMQIGENTVQIEFCKRTWEETVTIVEETPVAQIGVTLAAGKDQLYADQYLELDGATLQVEYTNGHTQTYTLSAFAGEIEGIYDPELGVVVAPSTDYLRLDHYMEGTQEVPFQMSYLDVDTTVTCMVRENVAEIEIANAEDHSLLITFRWADGSSEAVKVLQLANGYSYPGEEWREEGLLVTDHGVFWADFKTTQAGTYVTLDVGDPCESNVLPQADWLEAHKAALPIVPYLLYNDVCYDGTLTDELIAIVANACNLVLFDNLCGYDEEGYSLYRVDAEALNTMLKRFFGADADVTESGLYDAEQGCAVVRYYYRDYLTMEYSLAWNGNGWSGNLSNEENGRWRIEVDANNVLTAFAPDRGESSDFDGNGVVDTADVVLLLQQLNEQAADAEAGDVNGDGVVSLLDVLRLLKQISA